MSLKRNILNGFYTIVHVTEDLSTVDLFRETVTKNINSAGGGGIP